VYRPSDVANDLHKGRDTGKTWSILIDVSAVLMTLISLTGLILSSTSNYGEFPAPS